MKETLMTRIILAVSFSVVALSICSTASAQAGTFAASYNQFSGKVSFEDRRKAAPGPRRVDTTFLEPMVQQTWNRVRSALTTTGDNFLRERDLGGGFRTSNNVILLAEKGYLLVSTTSSGFSMKYVLPNNQIVTSLRTPGPLPAFSDPRIAISCDAVLKIDVFWTGSKLTIPPAQAIIGCRPPAGRNLTGDLGIGALKLINTLGGPDFIKQWLAPINNANFPLGQEITQDISRYTNGKLGDNTQISVSEADDGTDRSGKRISRLIIKIEDKEKEYVIH
jgi:hypothetical protein